MADSIRRVVTGHDADGKAVFASDSLVEPFVPDMLPGAAFHQLWGGDETPSFPGPGERPPASTYFPPVGGFRFGFFTLPPASAPRAGPEVDLAAAAASFEAALPGMRTFTEHDDPGMHTTSTIDFEVVMSGDVVLELDDGATVHLHPGDTVVQNGTRHRWSNPGDVPATLAVFMCGARHADVDAPTAGATE